MTVDIIIPNYNGSHLIEKNLPKVIIALKNYNGKIIIVDDGSIEKDKSQLKDIILKQQKEGVRIIFIDLKKNSGFPTAVNSGVATSSADFVVLLNSDVAPHEDFLKSPLEKLQNDNSLFGIGCMDRSIENGKTVLRGRGKGAWINGFLQHSKGEVDKTDTFWISGGSSVIRREYYKKLGGMDEIYNPFYWEDIDLSFRARKSGYKILFDPNSIVEHFHEEGAIQKNYKKSKVTTISYRNQFIFVWKNFTSSNFIIDHLFHLPLHIFSALKRGDTNFLKGLFIAIRYLPAIMKRRPKQRKLYKYSDAEIINTIA